MCTIYHPSRVFKIHPMNLSEGGCHIRRRILVILSLFIFNSYSGGNITYPFEEVIDNSKIPIVLTSNISQLMRNFENNMPGYRKEIIKVSN